MAGSEFGYEIQVACDWGLKFTPLATKIFNYRSQVSSANELTEQLSYHLIEYFVI